MMTRTNKFSLPVASYLYNTYVASAVLCTDYIEVSRSEIRSSAHQLGYLTENTKTDCTSEHGSICQRLTVLATVNMANIVPRAALKLTFEIRALSTGRARYSVIIIVIVANIAM